MILTLDIEGKANEIQRELLQDESTFSEVRTWLLKRKGQRQSVNFIKLLDEFILSLEGLQGHISEFTLEDAATLLSNAQNTIRDFHILNEAFEKDVYCQDPFLKERFRYLLQTLYKTEALLHLATTKDLPVMPTPDYIKEGLAKVSRETIIKAL